MPAHLPPVSIREAVPQMVITYEQAENTDILPQGVIPENIAPLPRQNFNGQTQKAFKIAPEYTIQTAFEGESTAVAEAKRKAGKVVGKIALEVWQKSKFSTPTVYIQSLSREESPKANQFGEDSDDNSNWLKNQINQTVAKQAKRKHQKIPKFNVVTLAKFNVDARADADVMDDMRALADSAIDYPDLNIPTFGWMQSAIKQGKVAELPAVAQQVFETSASNNNILVASVAGVSKKAASYDPNKSKH